MYRLICKDGNAKRGEVTTVHGVIQTPVFMNVGTAAAIKGAVSTMDLHFHLYKLNDTYYLISTLLVQQVHLPKIFYQADIRNPLRYFLITE